MSVIKAIASHGEIAIKALIDEIYGMLERNVWTGVFWSALSKTQQK